MKEVAEISREIANSEIKITVSVFLKTGIARRKYLAELKYSEELDHELPYIQYHAVFENIGKKKIYLSGTSPQQILAKAFTAVSKDAKEFTIKMLKSAGKSSRLNWPLYGFSGNKLVVSSY